MRRSTAPRQSTADIEHLIKALSAEGMASPHLKAFAAELLDATRPAPARTLTYLSELHHRARGLVGTRQNKEVADVLVIIASMLLEDPDVAPRLHGTSRIDEARALYEFLAFTPVEDSVWVPGWRVDEYLGVYALLKLHEVDRLLSRPYDEPVDQVAALELVMHLALQATDACAYAAQSLAQAAQHARVTEEVSFRSSQAARKGHSKRTQPDKQKVWTWYAENGHLYTIDGAAAKIDAIQLVQRAHKTIKKWIGEYRRQRRSGGKPRPPIEGR